MSILIFLENCGEEGGVDLRWFARLAWWEQENFDCLQEEGTEEGAVCRLLSWPPCCPYSIEHHGDSSFDTD